MIKEINNLDSGQKKEMVMKKANIYNHELVDTGA